MSSTTITLPTLSPDLKTKPEARACFAGDGQAAEGQALEARVSQRFTYLEDETVKAFLADHPQVAQILLDAFPRIEEFFGKGTAVFLRLSCDQESEPTLSANIQTALDVSEARAARKRFHLSWWMRQPETDSLPLTFNLQYL